MTPKKEDLIPFVNNRKEASKIFGVTEKTIVNWMKKYEIYHPKENYGCNKLNSQKAIEIRKLHLQGHTIKELAEKYEVTFATISRIIKNSIYKQDIDTALISVVYNANEVLGTFSSGLSAASNPVDEQK